MPTWLRLVITAVTLTLVLWWVDAGALWTSLRSGHTPLVALAAGLAILPVACSIGIWHVLVGHTQTWSTSTRAIMLGYTAGLLTPGRVGEWAPRVWVGPDQARSTRKKAAGREFVLRFSIHPFVLGMMLPIAGPVLDIPWAVAGSVVLVLLAAAAFFMGSRVPKGAGSLVMMDQASLLALFLVRYGVSVVQFAILFAAFGVMQPVADRIVGASVVLSVKGFIPNVMITDLGVREGIAALWGAANGLDAAPFVAAGMALYGVNVLFPALIGAVFAPARSSNERKTDG